jgi:hypothetical protein
MSTICRWDQVWAARGRSACGAEVLSRSARTSLNLVGPVALVGVLPTTVSPITLTFGHISLRPLVVVTAQRAAHVNLVVCELALVISPHVALVAWMRLNQLALSGHSNLHSQVAQHGPSRWAYYWLANRRSLYILDEAADQKDSQVGTDFSQRLAAQQESLAISTGAQLGRAHQGRPGWESP